MMPRDQRDWRQICDEVLREQNPDKLNALLAELLEVLEERAVTGSKRPSSSETSASKM
jgi:hypothetical protein